MARGTVKWFNNREGFGFLLDPLIEGDIFVHFTAIEGGGFRTLQQGEEVEYEIVSEEKGVRAARVVRIAPPAGPQPSPPKKAGKQNRRGISEKNPPRRPHGST
jgi:CspA family cold shock protein